MFCLFTVQSGCPDGFTEEIDDYCLKLVTSKKTWFDAGRYCASFSSILIEPRTKALNNKFKSYNNKPWIGASDIDAEGSWEWDSNMDALTWKDWAPNQPNNENGNQHCAAIQGNGKWGDFACSDTREFICQAEKGKSSLLLSITAIINYVPWVM